MGVSHYHILSSFSDFELSHEPSDFEEHSGEPNFTFTSGSGHPGEASPRRAHWSRLGLWLLNSAQRTWTQGQSPNFADSYGICEEKAGVSLGMCDSCLGQLGNWSTWVAILGHDMLAVFGRLTVCNRLKLLGYDQTGYPQDLHPLIFRKGRWSAGLNRGQKPTPSPRGMGSQNPLIPIVVGYLHVLWKKLPWHWEVSKLAMYINHSKSLQIVINCYKQSYINSKQTMRGSTHHEAKSELPEYHSSCWCVNNSPPTGGIEVCKVTGEPPNHSSHRTTTEYGKNHDDDRGSLMT